MKILFLIFLVFIVAFVSTNSEWTKVYQYKKAVQQWDLDCADNLNCISVASPNATGSMYIKTTDGGSNWFVSYIDTIILIYNEMGQWIDTEPAKFKPARCIDYVTPDLVVVGHKEGQITISRDGGYSWDSVQLTTTRDLNTVKFIDEFYGVAFGGYKTLFKTYNGGLDWEEFNLNYFGNEVENFAISEVNIDLVGKDSLIAVIYNYRDTSHKFYTIFRTFDGGKHWDMGTKIPRYSDYKPFFISMDEGWLTGRIGAGNQRFYDVIYYTSDGGLTWESQLDTLLYPELGLQGIYFHDYKEGIAFGEGGKIWRTSNSGQNWLQDSTFPFFGNDHFSELAFPNKNTNKILANVNLRGGIWMYKDLTSVNDNELRFDNINVFPNPTSDFITIPELNNGLQPIVHKMQIFDVLGIEVMSESIHPTTSSHQMNVEKLRAGVYFIRVGTRVEKFVKM